NSGFKFSSSEIASKSILQPFSSKISFGLLAINNSHVLKTFLIFAVVILSSGNNPAIAELPDCFIVLISKKTKTLSMLIPMKSVCHREGNPVAIQVSGLLHFIRND